MIRAAALASLLVLANASCAGNPPPAEAADPIEAVRASFAPIEEETLYAYGALMGGQLEQFFFDETQAEQIARGVVEAMLGVPEAGAAANALDWKAFEAARLREVAKIEEEASRPFLEAAARAPGAVVHDSGFIMTVIEEGDGDSPEDIYDWVVVHFTGSLRDGRVVMSSEGGKPMRRRLGQTVLCWQEALSLVSAGARIHVVCPASLAYRHFGASSYGVPGGAAMAFDLELVEVRPGEPPGGE